MRTATSDDPPPTPTTALDSTLSTTAPVGTPPTTAPVLNADMFHHPRDAPRSPPSAASRNFFTVRKSPAARSIGAAAPTVAALHAAPRNSRFVSARLWA